MTARRTEMVAVIAVTTARGADYAADINIPATKYDADPGVREKARINARADLEDMIAESIPGITRDQAFEYAMTGSIQTSRYWASEEEQR